MLSTHITHQGQDNINGNEEGSSAFFLLGPENNTILIDFFIPTFVGTQHCSWRGVRAVITGVPVILDFGSWAVEIARSEIETQ